MLVADTICALATPPGTGGLAVIRVSGPDAFGLVQPCLQTRTDLAKAEGHTIHYAAFVDGGSIVDTVTASVFRAPRSYTGEDCVEIGCHGGRIVARNIVAALVRQGARPAEPGEFTKRAFLNNKLDLTQVEAVADVIHAVSTPGAQAAARQLTGGFTKRLADIRNRLMDVCGLLELELDFSEEDLEFVDKNELHRQLREIGQVCRDLTESYESAHILRNGYQVGLIGFPNAGKSSLMNALLGRRRAIVSDTPGTTRDYLEETLHMDGIAFKLYDTAGMRSSDDQIEIEGIKLAESIVEQSNCVLVINDAGAGATHSDELAESMRARFGHVRIFTVQNKIDLVKQDIDELKQNRDDLFISASSGEGLDALRAHLVELATSSSARVNDVLINDRHVGLLQQVIESINNAAASIESAPSNEFIAVDVRLALKTLGEITGDNWSEDLLTEVFSRFCIGK